MGIPRTSSITKYGRPVSVAPASKNLGDVGMIHHRQRLPLGFEAGHDRSRVHPQLDDLQRHPPARREFSARRHTTTAESALADFLQQEQRSVIAFSPADDGGKELFPYVNEHMAELAQLLVADGVIDRVPDPIPQLEP
jgi:hypothetical protein